MRTRRAGIALMLVAVAALLVACGGSSSDGSALPRASGSTDSSKAPAGVAKKCRDVKGHRIVTGAIEREPLIPCSMPHNVEIVGTWPLYDKASRAAIEQYSAHCYEDLENSLDIVDSQVFRTQVAAVGVPTRPGHVKVQCEAWLLPGTGAFRNGPAAVTTSSLVDQARHGDHAGTTWCTDEIPQADGSRFVDCGRPHVAQALTSDMQIAAAGGAYPAAAIEARGQQMCRAMLRHRPDAATLSSYGWWWNQEVWKQSGRPAQVPGVCWYFRKDHKALPAIR